MNFHHRPAKATNIQRRFIFGVLIPPFIILLLIGAGIFWQLNTFVHSQAVGGLERSASTTAAKLEREFALRETVLKRTGDDLFNIKNDYQIARSALEANRDACSAHIASRGTFLNAPDNQCGQFLAEFALGGSRVQAVQVGYEKTAKDLIDDQNQRINERLSAYKQFFPETLAILVVDKNKQLVSSALSGDFKGSADLFMPDVTAAGSAAVIGRFIGSSDYRMAVFAYPITGGSVLAAYNLDDDGFIRGSWEGTPINRREAVAIILDADGGIMYPNFGTSIDLAPAHQTLRSQRSAAIDIKNANHIAVGATAGSSRWLVTVASPSAVVLAPVRDAQLAAVLIIGSLLVGFLWVGTIFIKRTIRSILRLVGGTVVFAGGNLDYKIQLENADQEFNQLADTMNTMAARIAAAEKELDEKNKEFISVATHELRTPLTVIIGYLEMATDSMDGTPGSNTKSFVQKAYDGTGRLRDLVNDMLDVARLEGGREEFNIEALDIQKVVSGVIDNLQITAKEKGITLTYDTKNAAKVLADESRLGIVLNNFVSNAIKYNRPNGSVTVTHSIDGGQFVTAVADTGLGIPEAQKAHMFEKFFRVQDTDRKGVIGTGLGMYITKRYIRKMNGDVRFESTHGKGTTFFFDLPLADSKSKAAPEIK